MPDASSKSPCAISKPIDQQVTLDPQLNNDEAASPTIECEVMPRPLNNIFSSGCELLQIAGPAALTQCLRFATNFVTAVYCGRTLDNEDYAAVMTGLSFTTLTALSIGQGIASALDTLATQAYGRNCSRHHEVELRSVNGAPPAEGSPDSAHDDSPHHHEAIQGTLLRKSLIVTFAVYVPIALMYWFCRPAIAFLVVNSLVDNVVTFLRYSCFIVVPMLATNNIIKYCQAQCDPMTGFYASLAGIVTLVPLLLLVRPVTVVAVVSCLALNRWMTLCFVVALFVRDEKLKRSWGSGFMHDYHRGALTRRELTAFLLVGLPSLIANIADTWSFEVMSILSAGVGPIAAATWSVLMTIYGTLFSVFVGFAAAASTKVGNSIGRGDVHRGRLHAEVVVGMTAALGALLAVALYLFGGDVYMLIQTDPVVAEHGRGLMKFGAFTFVADVTFYVMQGVFRGIGRQKQCAHTVIAGMWFVAVPLAVVLTKVAHWEVYGPLTGLSAGLLVATPLQLILLFRVIDWNECAAEAHRRLHPSPLPPSPDEQPNSNVA